MEQSAIDKEKYFIKMMILNAYIVGGVWAFSLDSSDVIHNIGKLRELFVKKGLTTSILDEDENGEYSNYKRYLLSLFDGSKKALGHFNEEYNEVWIGRALAYLTALFDVKEEDIEFVEWGSYYITNYISVFRDEKDRMYRNMCEAQKDKLR